MDVIEETIIDYLKKNVGGNPRPTDSLALVGVDSVGMAELTFELEKRFSVVSKTTSWIWKRSAISRTIFASVVAHLIRMSNMRDFFCLGARCLPRNCYPAYLLQEERATDSSLSYAARFASFRSPRIHRESLQGMPW